MLQWIGVHDLSDSTFLQLPARERLTERRSRAVADEWLCIVRPWGFLSARSVSIKLALVNVAAAD